MLQFQLSRLFGLAVRAHGMALVGPEGIRLAFHRPENEPQGLLDAKVESVLIDWQNLEEVAAEHGLLSDRLSLRVKSIEPLRALPGVTDPQLELEVRRQDRQELEQFARKVAEYRSGQAQDNVEQMLDDVRGFLEDPS